MLIVATDQTKKYLCILTKQYILRCFNVNCFSQFFQFIEFKCIDIPVFMHLRSYNIISKQQESSQNNFLKYLIVCIVTASNKIVLINTKKKKIIEIKLRNTIQSTYIFEHEVYVVSDNIIFILDLDNGEIKKKIKLEFYNISNKNIDSNLYVSKKGHYLCFQKGFVLIIYLKFGLIVKYLLDKYRKVILTNLINRDFIIILLNNKFLKSWNINEELYQDLDLLIINERNLRIKTVKKLYLKDTLFLIFLAESSLNGSYLIVFKNTKKRLEKLTIVSLCKNIDTIETLFYGQLIIVICKYQGKIIPIKIKIENFKCYPILVKLFEIQKKYNIRCLNYKSDNYKQKENVFNKKVLKNIILFKKKKNVRCVNITFKIKKKNLVWIGKYNQNFINTFIFLTKFKYLNIFSKQLRFASKNNFLRVIRKIDRNSVEPLFIFILKNIFKKKFNCEEYLIWMKEIIFFHFSYLSKNCYLNSYLHKIIFFTKCYAGSMFLRNLLTNINMLKIQNERYLYDQSYINIKLTKN
nr:hypothetical protein 1634Bnrm3_p099 [Cryptomonas sp.]